MYIDCNMLTRNIKSVRPSAKLDHKRLGPFLITKKINDVTFQLDLPETYKIANCFHCALLEPASEDYMKNRTLAPAPIQVENHEEYYVERILDMKIVDKKTFYLINWYGYSDADNTWEPLECLTGCEEALEEFHAALQIKNPLKN